ncbi:hypothetical protein I552_2794 [Mycobacterium xenopi 3993]|nr:hypothetical protein I552_2794 [Mycobacterium xenopi 3993]
MVSNGVTAVPGSSTTIRKTPVPDWVSAAPRRRRPPAVFHLGAGAGEPVAVAAAGRLYRPLTHVGV